MTKKWLRERKRDSYYKQAKRSGYRSRSAFKLKQINERYNVISKNDTVLDLGCAPGGWLQIAKEYVGPGGTVVGVDLQRIEPIDGVTFVRGDMTEPATQKSIVDIIPQADCVLSDMSPKITGNYSMDHARSIDLAEKALKIARKILKSGGCMVVKVFMGDMYNDYLENVKQSFSFLKAHSPKASRKASSEIYVIGKDFSGT